MSKDQHTHTSLGRRRLALFSVRTTSLLQKTHTSDTPENETEHAEGYVFRENFRHAACTKKGDVRLHIQKKGRAFTLESTIGVDDT